MKLTVRQPSGIAPKVAATELKDNVAQVATNCRLDQGDWCALRAPAVVKASWGAGALTVYRFGQDGSDETQYWWQFATDVDIQKAPFFGDTRELTFFTQAGVLKYSTITAALAGEPYPTASYLIADQPAGTMTPSVSGTGDGTDQEYTYVQTQVTVEGIQSRPSASVSVTAQLGQTVTLTQLAFPGGQYNFGNGAKKQLWRSTNSNTFELRAEKAYNDATSWADVVANNSMGDVLPPFTEWNLIPPTGFHSLVSMPGFFMMGAQGRDVYPSRIAPDVAGFPESYRLTFEHPVVALCAFGSDACFVGTTGYPAILRGPSPDSLQPIYAQGFPQSCVSKRSAVAMDVQGILVAIYASPDGLCAVDANGNGRVLTADVLTRDYWQALNPSSIHAYVWDKKYIGFYNAGGGNTGGFIFDPNDEREPFVLTTVYATAGYYDPKFDKLYLQIGSNLSAFDAGSALTATWKSKEWSFPFDKTMRAAQVLSNTYAGITYRFYGDGVLLFTKTVTGPEPFRIGAAGRKRYKKIAQEIEFSGDRPHEVSTATSVEELTQ